MVSRHTIGKSPNTIANANQPTQPFECNKLRVFAPMRSHRFLVCIKPTDLNSLASRCQVNVVLKSWSRDDNDDVSVY